MTESVWTQLLGTFEVRVEWGLLTGNPSVGQQADAAWQGATYSHLLRIEQCNGIPSVLRATAAGKQASRSAVTEVSDTILDGSR